eukprot:819996-Amphidinium_carterae.1
MRMPNDNTQLLMPRLLGRFCGPISRGAPHHVCRLLASCLLLSPRVNVQHATACPAPGALSCTASAACGILIGRACWCRAPDHQQSQRLSSHTVLSVSTHIYVSRSTSSARSKLVRKRAASVSTLLRYVGRSQLSEVCFDWVGAKP